MTTRRGTVAPALCPLRHRSHTRKQEPMIELAPALIDRVRRAAHASGRLQGDQGEGVISAAIAVLIMAFLGALMWVSFQKMWHTTEDNTNKHVEQMTQE
jgi:hypothetical protein